MKQPLTPSESTRLESLRKKGVGRLNEYEADEFNQLAKKALEHLKWRRGLLAA